MGKSVSETCVAEQHVFMQFVRVQPVCGLVSVPDGKGASSAVVGSHSNSVDCEPGVGALAVRLLRWGPLTAASHAAVCRLL